MLKPLVIYSKPDLPHTSALMQCSDLLDFAELGDVPEGNWSSAYMRCAHYTWNDELELAGKVEEQLRSRKIHIINSVENRIRCQRKDYYYPLLAHGGVAVPVFVHHPTIHEIRFMLTCGLSWPFLHRSADGSRGRDAFLVHNEQEFYDADKALIAKEKRRIAAQFIDSKGPNKYFIRRRAFVVFKEIDMWISDISDSWNTQSEKTNWIEIKDLNRENKKWKPSAQACADAIRVGEVLGLDIYAVDMVPDLVTGIHYVVDVNPTYRASPTPAVFPRSVRNEITGHFLRVARKLCDQRYPV